MISIRHKESMRLLLSLSAAKIGDGVLLDHGTGLVIGETAVVGNWVSLMQVSIQGTVFFNHFPVPALLSIV